MLGALGFLTTLPVWRTERLMHVPPSTSFFPAVGALLGIIIGTISSVLIYLIAAQPDFIAVVIMISIYLLTGFHHLDALSDFGDGVTAHGSREKKIGALKDKALGAGGAAFIILYMLLLFVIIKSIIILRPDGLYVPAVSLFIAEVASKQSMLVVAWLGTPIHRGMGSMTSDNTGFKEFFTGLLISILVCTAALGAAGIIALLLALVFALLILWVSNRHFGGINGDCIGTANEIGRITALLAVFMIFAGGIGLWMPW